MNDPLPIHPDTDEVSSSLLRLVADAVPALMAYYELGSLRCRFANRRYAQYNGWTAQTIVGKTVREVVGDQSWAVIEPQVKAVSEGKEVTYVRAQTLPDGSKRVIEVNLTPHFATDGHQLGAFVLINDITDNWLADQANRESEERLRKFMHASSEGILFHRDEVIVDVNEALVRLSGYPAEALIGRRTVEFVPAEWHATLTERLRARNEDPYEAAIRHSSGRSIPVEFVCKSIRFRGEEQRLVVLRDITMRKQAQERIEFLALHDPLTELPNRLYLNEFVPRTLALARRQGKGAAVLFADLDGFKPINDTLGHDAGDAMLRDVAQRLRGAVRDSDLVARLGGDEFLMVLTGIASTKDVEQVAQALLAAMRMPITWRGRTLTLSMSLGIGLYPEHADSSEQLIRCADAAMYRAKVNGGNRYHLGKPAPRTSN